MIILVRPFHTSKLKIDASHKHDDRLAALIGAADAVECILIAILENVYYAIQSGGNSRLLM